MKNLKKKERIKLDDLPQFSYWIPYLLGIKKLEVSLEKDAENIQREYEDEKWGVLLKEVLGLHAPTILDADRLFIGEKKIPYFDEGELYVDSARSVDDRYFDIIKQEIAPLTKLSGHLVELGGGYGSVIIKLAMLPELKGVGFTVGELTKSGVSLIKLLSAQLPVSFKCGPCDLNNLSLKRYQIPKRATFMTNWTMACLKGFPRATLEEILAHSPTEVVHIEPTYQHWSVGSMLHNLWQSYAILNDYNLTYFSDLQKYEREGLIEILDEKKNIFGSNPLGPVSVIRWRPKENI